MRVVDELIDRPVDKSLPAPSGLPAPAGQRPIVPPPHLNSDPTVPSGPRLPARETRQSSSPTGQDGLAGAASSLVEAALAALAAANATGTAAPVKEEPKPKQLRKRLIALAIVLATGTTAAIIFRHSSLADRFTGRGYDTNPLPVHGFPQPPFKGADYTITTQSVTMKSGLATNVWETERDEVNFEAKTAKATFNRAKASIIGGTIGKAQSTSPAEEFVIDQESSYRPGATAADPWVRIKHAPGWWEPSLSRNEVHMYQDVIDPTLRAQDPTKVISETRHEVPVTTYTYTFEFGKFYESAPRLFDLVQMMDGNAADDATVTVTVSMDDQWMVRYLDVEVDHQSVLDHRAKLDPEGFYPYRFTVDLVSVTDTPVSISAPANAVDEPVAESTTTTAVVP
jgi:hypothetical protein